MAGLVAPPDNVDADDPSVAADGWFPAVALASVRDTLRLGEGVVTTERLTAAIEGAMISAFRALAAWRSARATEGYAGLAEVRNAAGVVEQLNGEPVTVKLWQRIIRNYAAAELADLDRDISATDQGLDRAAEKQLTADDYRRLAYAAVADLLSIGAAEPEPRNRVALI